MGRPATSPPRYINALHVQTFSNATAAGLATDITTWLDANGKQRTFVQLDYLYAGAAFVALLTYTE